MTSDRTRWPMFRQVERRARRTQDMITRLNVDALKLVRARRGELYAEVSRKCLECCNSAQCIAWLELEKDEAARPDFCPNLKTFLRFRRAAANKATGDTNESC